jgi:hypothetical protein
MRRLLLLLQLLWLPVRSRGSRVRLVFHADGLEASDWAFTSDPVMGGRSEGTFRVDAHGRGVMAGSVRTVPSLNGPGFIKIQTTGWRTFPDATSCTHIGLVAKSLGEGYAGYRFGFGNSKAPRSSRHASGHKASFKDPGPAFVNVSMPFTSFSNYWNAATGENIVECSEDAQFCPKPEHLKNLGTISIWAEGVNGEVALTIQELFLEGCSDKGGGDGDEGGPNVSGVSEMPESSGTRVGCGDTGGAMSASAMVFVALFVQNWSRWLSA